LCEFYITKKGCGELELRKILDFAESSGRVSAQEDGEVLGEGDDGILQMLLLVVPGKGEETLDEAKLDLRIC